MHTSSRCCCATAATVGRTYTVRGRGYSAQGVVTGRCALVTSCDGQSWHPQGCLRHISTHNGVINLTIAPFKVMYAAEGRGWLRGGPCEPRTAERRRLRMLAELTTRQNVGIRQIGIFKRPSGCPCCRALSNRRPWTLGARLRLQLSYRAPSTLHAGFHTAVCAALHSVLRKILRLAQAGWPRPAAAGGWPCGRAAVGQGRALLERGQRGSRSRHSACA